MHLVSSINGVYVLLPSLEIFKMPKVVNYVYMMRFSRDVFHLKAQIQTFLKSPNNTLLKCMYFCRQDSGKPMLQLQRNKARSIQISQNALRCDDTIPSPVCMLSTSISVYKVVVLLQPCGGGKQRKWCHVTPALCIPLALDYHSDHREISEELSTGN